MLRLLILTQCHNILPIWQISFCYLVSSYISMFYGFFFFFKPRIGEIIFFNLHLVHGPAGLKINPFLYGGE